MQAVFRRSEQTQYRYFFAVFWNLIIIPLGRNEHRKVKLKICIVWQSVRNANCIVRNLLTQVSISKTVPIWKVTTPSCRTGWSMRRNATQQGETRTNCVRLSRMGPISQLVDFLTSGSTLRLFAGKNRSSSYPHQGKSSNLDSFFYLVTEELKRMQTMFQKQYTNRLRASR